LYIDSTTIFIDLFKVAVCKGTRLTLRNIIDNYTTYPHAMYKQIVRV